MPKYVSVLKEIDFTRLLLYSLAMSIIATLGVNGGDIICLSVFGSHIFNSLDSFKAALSIFAANFLLTLAYQVKAACEPKEPPKPDPKPKVHYRFLNSGEGGLNNTCDNAAVFSDFLGKMLIPYWLTKDDNEALRIAFCKKHKIHL